MSRYLVLLICVIAVVVQGRPRLHHKHKQGTYMFHRNTYSTVLTECKIDKIECATRPGQFCIQLFTFERLKALIKC